MLMLESIKVRNKLNGDHKRYSLSEMVSESYRVLYSCKRGTPLYKLVEAHINDVRENPAELEKLSENLHLLKQAAKLGSKVRINEDEIAQTKPDKTLTDESKTEDVDQMEGPDVIDEADERFKTKKSLLPTVDEIELKEKACKESIRKVLGKKSVKESEIVVSTPDATVAIETDGEEDFEEPAEAVVAEEPVVYESKARSYKNCKNGLKNFCESSRSKAFYKTFKRMSESLKDKKSLTLAESISLYKAANSAMTQLAIELEHNPGFLKTFSECTALLSRDTRNLLTCIKTSRAPSHSILESLSSFSNVLLEEDEPDWTEEQDEPVETTAEETPAEAEEEVTPEEAIADAIEEEIPEEVAEEIADEVETAETPAEAVEEVLEDISEEEAEDLLKYLYVMRQAEGETEDYQDAEMPDDFDAGDITDDELAELASHLKEARRVKKIKEARSRMNLKEATLRPFSRTDWEAYAGASKLPSGEEPMIGISKNGEVEVVVSGDEDGGIIVEVIYEDEDDMKTAQKSLNDLDTATRLANGIIGSYDSGKDIGQLLNSYKFRMM